MKARQQGTFRDAIQSGVLVQGPDGDREMRWIDAAGEWGRQAAEERDPRRRDLLEQVARQLSAAGKGMIPEDLEPVFGTWVTVTPEPSAEPRRHWPARRQAARQRRARERSEDLEPYQLDLFER